MCFRVGALGELIAFALNLLLSYLPVAGCNLIVFSSEESLGEFTTVCFEFAFRVNLAVAGYNLIDCFIERASSSAETFSVYFRGIKGIDILATCGLCLYVY